VLVRDRIDMVTDHESAFLEFSTLSGFGHYDDEVPGGGIVTVIVGPEPRDQPLTPGGG
jgi:3-methylcrotonyl-CoA carboxylase beta subunit